MVHRARQGFVEAAHRLASTASAACSREFGIVLPLKAATVRREAARAARGSARLGQHRRSATLLSELHRLDERIAAVRPPHRADRARGRAQPRSLMQLLGHRHAPPPARWSGDDRQRPRVQVRPPARGLAGPGAGAVQLGRQDAPGPHHQGRRRLPAHAAGAGRQGGAGRGQEQGRPAQPLGAGAARQRRGYWKAVVAIAAKNARMAWAVLAKGENFKLLEA